MKSEVRVTHGANDGTYQIAGLSVGQVRRKLRTAYNLPADAQATVDGVKVEEDHRLRAGEHLEFCKEWGEKGADDRDDYFIHSNDVLLKLNEVLFRLNRLEELVKEAINVQAPAKEYYSVEDFAKLVDLAPYTVRDHCRLGRLNAQKAACGRGNIPEWRIPHAELVRYRNHGLLPIPKNSG